MGGSIDNPTPRPSLPAVLTYSGIALGIAGFSYSLWQACISDPFTGTWWLLLFFNFLNGQLVGQMMYRGSPFGIDNPTPPSLPAVITYSGIALGIAGFSYSLWQACISDPFTGTWWSLWFFNFLNGQLVGQMMCRGSPFGMVEKVGPEFKYMFPFIFGMHTFSPTASILLCAMLFPKLDTTEEKMMAFLSAAMLLVGGVAAVVAHFFDRWVFRVDTQGVANVVFASCFVAGFDFLAVTFFFSYTNLALACVPPIIVATIPLYADWGKNKKVSFAFQGVGSLIATIGFIQKTGSWWPLVFLCQAFNIIRCGPRILTNDAQILHFFTSMYGWASYIFPMGISLQPEWQDTPLWFVSVVGLGSILLVDVIEQKLLRLEMKGINFSRDHIEGKIYSC
jgi:hypothetical protein